MSSSVHCPKDKEIIPMENCNECDFIRKKEDVSTVFCRFLIGNRQFEEERSARAAKERPNDETRRISALINFKQKKADHFYKTGKPRIAEQIEFEIMKLRKEIKQHEIENQTFYQKEKAAQ